jgi:hypothetical protein
LWLNTAVNYFLEKNSSSIEDFKDMAGIAQDGERSKEMVQSCVENPPQWHKYLMVKAENFDSKFNPTRLLNGNLKLGIKCDAPFNFLRPSLKGK